MIKLNLKGMHKNKYLSFLYSFTMGFSINLIGKLFVAEVFALLSLPFLKLKRIVLRTYGLRKIVICFFGLLGVQILSDLVNETSPPDFLRGWAVILFSLISLLFLVNQIARDNSSIVYFLIGSLIVKLIFGEGELVFQEDNSNYFKIRFIGFINPLVTLLTYWFYKNRKKGTAVLVLLFYGLLCVVMDARSNALIFLISAVFLLIKNRKITLNIRKTLALTFIILPMIYAFYAFYIYNVLHEGFGGSNTKDQVALMENPYNPFELLYYGRSDAIIGIVAIGDAPFIGHGSWAKDKTGKYLNLKSQLLNRDNITDRGFIPSHSILISTWLYAGILGFVAMLFIFKITAKQFLFLFQKTDTSFMPIVIVLFVSLVWNFLFSPFGHLRTSVPITIALILSLSQNYKFNQKIKSRYVPEN